MGATHFLTQRLPKVATEKRARLQHEARDSDCGRGRAAGGLAGLSQGLAHAPTEPEGASGAFGNGFQETFALGDANASGVLRAVPIQNHFETAWAQSRNGDRIEVQGACSLWLEAI